jgi:solute carrier family 39 (zinc transporter), member 1/2/3
MSFSVGTFIYIGAAEIIVEEFSISRYKWQKFLMYLLGGIMIAGLTIWEITSGGHDHGGDDHDHDHDHDHKY